MSDGGIPIIDGFNLGSKSNLDKRKNIQSVSELVTIDENTIPEGLIIFVEGNYYQFSSENEVTEDMGRWRKTNIAGHPEAYMDGETLVIS